MLKSSFLTVWVLSGAFLEFCSLAHAQDREKVPSVVPLQATPFPLEDARLLDGPFQVAQDTDRAYLLRLDTDRLLSGMRPGHYRVYSRDYNAFWCCVGTGMENHGKYGKMIDAHAGGTRLYVNLFLPSVLTSKEAGLTLRQETTFPQSPQSRLVLTLTQPRKMTLSLRCPGWIAPGGQVIRLNGKIVSTAAKPGAFAEMTRVWHSGDTLDIALPMQVRSETLPGSAEYAAFFYGPILLAGPHGTSGLTPDDFRGGVPFNGPGQLAQKSLPIDQFPSFSGTPAQAVPQGRRVPRPALVSMSRDPPSLAAPRWFPFTDCISSGMRFTGTSRARPSWRRRGRWQQIYWAALRSAKLHRKPPMTYVPTARTPAMPGSLSRTGAMRRITSATASGCLRLSRPRCAAPTGAATQGARLPSAWTESRWPCRRSRVSSRRVIIMSAIPCRLR